MGLVRLAIDYEFASRTWWEAGGQELWEAVCEGDAGAAVLDESVASSWLEQARGLPGWDDGPEYAPHPIATSPVDPDEDALA